MRRRSLVIVVLAAACAAAAARASAPPVGALPPGPIATIATTKGEYLAVALPARKGGRVWRIARPFDAKVVGQTAETDATGTVIVVFKAVGRGQTTIVFALTRGETKRAYESRRYVVTVT